jgi:hypothetical protein
MKIKTVLAFLAALPVFAFASECTCGKTNPTEEFVKEARKVYPTPLYSSYTNSIIRKYKCKKGMHDKNEGALVGWVDVDGARNVRDLGGWNGLAAGKVYRGSELNAVKNHGLALTPEGLRTMREKMKIKTDLDFRAVNEGERAECLKTSALGKDVKLVDRPISNYTSMFSKTNSFASALRVFADSGNYPIYMHCWGGADRTGTIAFILQASSSESAFFIRIPIEAPLPSPTISAVGVASPSEQGQAITSTATALSSESETLFVIK